MCHALRILANNQANTLYNKKITFSKYKQWQVICTLKNKCKAATIGDNDMSLEFVLCHFPFHCGKLAKKRKKRKKNRHT